MLLFLQKVRRAE